MMTFKILWKHIWTDTQMLKKLKIKDKTFITNNKKITVRHLNQIKFNKK